MNSISSDVIRGYNDTMILFLLLQNPSYGYEVSKQIKELSSEKYIIKETTLYSRLPVWRKTVMLSPFRQREAVLAREGRITVLPIMAASITGISVMSGI